MKRAFEEISVDKGRREEILGELLEYNRNKPENEGCKMKGEIDINKNEISPYKGKKSKLTIMKRVLAAAAAVLVIGTGIFAINNVIGEKNAESGSCIEMLKQDKSMPTIELYLRKVIYNEKTASFTVMASEDETDSQEEYEIEVGENNIFDEGENNIKAADVEGYNDNSGCLMKIYYDGSILERYPAQINARAVVMYYSNAKEYETVENKTLGVSLEYNKQIFEYEDSAEELKTICFRAEDYTVKDGETVPVFLSISISDYDFDDTVDGLLLQADTGTSKDISQEEFSYGTGISNAHHIQVCQDDIGRTTHYYVVDAPGNFSDGRAYIIEIADCAAGGWSTKYMSEWEKMLGSFKFVEKEGMVYSQQASDSGHEKEIFNSDGTINEEVKTWIYKGTLYSEDSQNVIGEYYYESIKEEVSDFLRAVTFTGTDREVNDSEKKCILSIQLRDNDIVKVTAYSGGVLVVDYGQTEEKYTTDKDIYGLLSEERDKALGLSD